MCLLRFRLRFLCSSLPELRARKSREPACLLYHMRTEWASAHPISEPLLSSRAVCRSVASETRLLRASRSGTRRTSGVRSSRIGAALPLRLGLGASLPLVGVELIALLIFIAQIILSSLWLSAFRYGPLEWIWRILTYGRYFPCRR